MRNRIKILIVEDENDVAESIKLSLEEKDYDIVDIVSTGEEAIECIKSKYFDLVLMDIVLASEMSGTEAAEIIKRRFNIPIVFLTAFCNEYMLEQAKISQPFGYILKPFNERELYASIELALYRSNTELKQNRINILLNISNKINHLINHEKDRQALLSEACNILLENPEYVSSFIIELDNSQNIVASVESNLGNDFSLILDKIKSQPAPQWFSNTLTQNSNYVKVEEVYSKGNEKQIFITVKLVAEQKTYGILAVSLEERQIEFEEQQLLESIASEVGFALNRIELKGKSQIMENALEESVLKYKQVIENAADIIFTTDLNFKITYVNHSGLLSTGYSAEELLNMNCLSMVPEEYREKLIKFYDELKETRTSNSYIEYPVITKDKELKWYGQNASILYENKDVIGFHCISRDITERKKIESALYESEKRYRQLVEMSPDAILVYAQGKIIFTNDAGNILFGANNNEELIGKSITDLFFPDAIDVSKVHAKYITKDESLKSLREQQIKKLDGTTVSVELTASNVFFHSVKAVQVVLRDISERKRVEEELRNRQREVNTLLDSLPAYAFFKDSRSRYITANRIFCNAIGYRKEAIVGKTDFDFFPKAIAEKFKSDDEKVINTGENLFVYESEIFDQGKPVSVDIRKVPLKDHLGKIIGLIGLAFDITERKTAEEAIKKYTSELEELNANKDKFFSIISHDLRSPFQGLLGLSNILAEEFDDLDIDEIKLFASNIHNSTKNLFNLLENLLQWSRIQTGKLELKPVSIDLQEELLYNINLLRENATKKDIKIINEINESISVTTDLNILNSTIQNLISNAIKFTFPGGEIKISAISSGNFIELSVSDTGTGIKKEDLDKLFRIDTQYTTQGTDRESGTGLGLTICKELLEKQGCDIWVESEPGKGSKFTFTLRKSQE